MVNNKGNTVEKATKRQVPLIIEDHPESYTGLPFVTLIQYNKESHLAIVDNAADKTINAFVIDLCGPEGIDQQALFELVTDWYENNRTDFPLSIAFSSMGLTGVMSPIYRTFNIDFVSRIIGPLPKFRMQSDKSIRRRKRKDIQPNTLVNR